MNILNRPIPNNENETTMFVTKGLPPDSIKFLNEDLSPCSLKCSVHWKGKGCYQTDFPKTAILLHLD